MAEKNTDIMDKVLGLTPSASTEKKDTDTVPEADKGKDAPAVDEAAVLAFLNKKHGKEYKSLDELTTLPPATAAKELTKEEKELLAKQKKDNTLIYGIQSGKVKAEELSAYAVAQNTDAAQFAFDQFKAEALAEDKELTDEDIRQQFEDENFLNSEPDDKRRIRAEKRMLKEKADYLKKTFGHIDALDADYELHENEQTSRKEYDTRIPAIVANTTKEIKSVFKYVGDDTKDHEFTYNFKIPDETFNELKTKYLTDDYFKAFKQGGLKDEKIAETILTEAKLRHFDQIVAEAAEAFHDEKKKALKMGRLGVLPARESGGSGGMTVGSTQGLQIMDKILST